MHRVTAGAVSGAVATLALNAATYVDIAVRGRAPSTVPADTVDKTARAIGVDLAVEGDEEVAAHRRMGIATLLGYGTGLVVGALYGVVRPAVPQFTLPIAGPGLAATAMVVANAGAVAAGTTDPRRWGVAGWLADIVPHLCFGFTAAAAYQLLVGQHPRHPATADG